MLSLQSTVSNAHAPGYGGNGRTNGRVDDQSEWARQEQQVSGFK